MSTYVKSAGDWSIPSRHVGRKVRILAHLAVPEAVGRTGTMGARAVVTLDEPLFPQMISRQMDTVQNWTKIEFLDDDWQQKYEDLWEALDRFATDKGYCAAYDEWARAHGGTARQQPWFVEVTLRTTVTAGSHSEARALARKAAEEFRPNGWSLV